MKGSSTWRCFLALIPVMAAAVDIRLVPVAGTGHVVIEASDPMNTQVIMDPGETVRIDAVVSRWAGELLRGVVVECMLYSLVSGDGGSLFVQDLDPNDDGACDFPPAICPLCRDCPFCGLVSPLNGLFVDRCAKRCNGLAGSLCNRTDPYTCPGEGGYLACLFGFPEFYGNLPPLDGHPVRGGTNPAWLALLSICSNAVGAADDGYPHYAGSFVLTAGPAARGTFELTQMPPPCGIAGCGYGGSRAINQNSQMLRL